MNTLIRMISLAALSCIISSVSLTAFADDAGNKNLGTKIEIKDFAFSPSKITVKSGRR